MDWFAQQETLFLAVFLQKKHLETFLGKLELCYWQTTMDIFYLELSGLLMIHPKKYDIQSRPLDIFNRQTSRCWPTLTLTTCPPPKSSYSRDMTKIGRTHTLEHGYTKNNPLFVRKPKITSCLRAISQLLNPGRPPDLSYLLSQPSFSGPVPIPAWISSPRIFHLSYCWLYYIPSGELT